jgi:hypothetical protein
MVRQYPAVKIWTAATEDIVKKIEHVHGEVKLKELYYQLPKKLGFKLIPITQLYKILGTRPSKEMESAKKHFSSALSKVSPKNYGNETSFEDNLKGLRAELLGLRKKYKEKLMAITPEMINKLLEDTIADTTLRGAIHQLIDEIVVELKKPKVALAKYFSSKNQFIKDFMAKAKGQTTGESIWFANRGTLFEHSIYENRMLVEQYRSLSGL